MALISRRARPDRLRVHAPEEESWRADLPTGTLERQFVEPLHGAAALQWELAGQLGLGEMFEAWPGELRAPAAARLLCPIRRRGAVLDVELAAGEAPAALGVALRELLLGIETTGAPEVAGDLNQPTEAIVEPPEPEDEEEPDLADEPDAESDDAPDAKSASTEGPFAATEATIGDSDGRVRAEDLAWLNPGDLLLSERRGRLRIKQVEDETRQVLARDESGELLMLGFDELVADCTFED